MSLVFAGYGQFWPACQEEEDLLTWLLDPDVEEEKSLPPLNPILLLVLDLSTAIVKLKYELMLKDGNKTNIPEIWINHVHVLDPHQFSLKVEIFGNFG